MCLGVTCLLRCVARKMRRTVATTLCVCSVALFITLWVASIDSAVFYRAAAPILLLGGANDSVSTGIACYGDDSSNNLEDISTSSETPAKGKTIFFHETSCASSSKGKLVLTPRQACAVESAAKMNPDLDVYLLFASPVRNTNVSQWRSVVRQLLEYPNVRIRHVSLDRYIAGSPLEDWYRGGALQTSRWPRSHASDVLRFLTLWKFGGTYLDLDVVVTRSLSGMSNFAGAESLTDVAAGVLNFAHDGVGHEMAAACLEDLRTQFRGDDWGHNGPGVITRVLKQVCGVRQIHDMAPERCRGFTVHPPSSFYPIPWRQWKLYFDEKNANKTMSKLSDSLAIHVWNKFSVADNITVGSRQPYAQIAQKFCPKVYSHCGKIF